PPSPPLVPYTPLFRSPRTGAPLEPGTRPPPRPPARRVPPDRPLSVEGPARGSAPGVRTDAGRLHQGGPREPGGGDGPGAPAATRSEEHTSELQSRENL